MSEQTNAKKERKTNDDFIVAWETSTSTAQVAEKLGTSVGNVFQRAKRLRELGVELKEFERARNIDIAALNAKIKALREAAA